MCLKLIKNLLFFLFNFFVYFKSALALMLLFHLFLHFMKSLYISYYYTSEEYCFKITKKVKTILCFLICLQNPKLCFIYFELCLLIYPILNQQFSY